MSKPHDLPSDAFFPLIPSPDTEQRTRPQQQPDPSPTSPPEEDFSDTSPTDPAAAGMTKRPERQARTSGHPQSILKKKGSFDSSRTQAAQVVQYQEHRQPRQQHASVSILKRNSAGPEIAMSMPCGSPNQVHPILKKSISEDRTWWREEPLHVADDSSPSSSAAATPRPILKKRSSVDDVVRVSNEIRPILKRKDSPKSDPEFMPKPIIKSLSRNGSDESNSSPTGLHTSRVMIQEPEIDHAADNNRFTGPFMARVMQPRRKSHPASAEDLRILHHPLLNGKRSPLPFGSATDERMSAAQQHHHYHHQHQRHDHSFPLRRSPPLLKSLPTSPSSGFGNNGTGLTFVDEFDKKLSLAAEQNSISSRNGGDHILDHQFNKSHLQHQQPDDQ